jgi:hypothetical protein
MSLDDKEQLRAVYEAKEKIASVLIEFNKTQLAPLEIQDLPRCVLDEAIKVSYEKDVDMMLRYAFTDGDLPDDYRLYHSPNMADEDQRGYFIDLLEYVGEPGERPENDFTLTSTRYRNGKLKVDDLYPGKCEWAAQDRKYIDTLFKKCVEKSVENREKAVQALNAKKVK